MEASNRNKTFLTLIDSETKTVILKSIAAHIGITPEDAYTEVTAAESEHLLDYMVEPCRTATSLLMQRHNMRGW